MGIAGGSWSVVRVRWVVVYFARFAVLCCSVESWVRGRNRRVASDSGSRLKKFESELELELGAWSFWSGRWRQASGAEGHSVTYRINDKVWQLKRNQLLNPTQTAQVRTDYLKLRNKTDSGHSGSEVSEVFNCLALHRTHLSHSRLRSRFGQVKYQSIGNGGY